MSVDRETTNHQSYGAPPFGNPSDRMRRARHKHGLWQNGHRRAVVFVQKCRHRLIHSGFFVRCSSFPHCPMRHYFSNVFLFDSTIQCKMPVSLTEVRRDRL